MNKIVLTLVAILIYAGAFAQLQPKLPNFTSFRSDEKKITPLLEKMSSASAKQHPEYGVLPFNSQCAECVELIDKRTVDSRFFVDPKNAGHTWSQKSYFPLHYKSDSNDVWHTIDQRLRPDAANTGVYIAKNQPVPTKLDLNKRNTSLNLGEREFSFNNNLTMYFFEADKAYTETQKGDYTQSFVGEEGLAVYNMWKGIDMHQTFMAGKIETNYIINSMLDIPVSDSGFMVIEDHFTIPDGYTFTQATDGPYSKEGYYRGDYLLKNGKGEILATYEKPIYTDAKSFGMHGDYNLLRSGNNYTLQIMVPVTWLKNPDNVFPIVIDPLVQGSSKDGSYAGQPGYGASLGFTTYTEPTVYCGYHMQVPVPGKSHLTNVYLQTEWQLTFDNTCQSAPPAPSPECTYTDVFQEVVCDSCNTSELISCKRGVSGEYIGTCTTNPILVPGADSIPIITNPPFVSCYTPQCADYVVNFTLRNMDSVCGETCGYLCARGNMWVMTVEGMLVSGNITQNISTVCAGQPVTDTAHAYDGVPPYSYRWIYGADSTSISADSIFTYNPQRTTTVSCIIYDACNVMVLTNVLTDVVSSKTAAPVIHISGDTLTSSYATGNQWYHNNSLLEGDTQQIYIGTIPGNYTVSVYDSSCGIIYSAPVVYEGIENILGSVSGVKISPNPSNGNFVLKFTSQQNFPSATLSIYNSVGQLMDNRNMQIVSGANNYALQIGKRLAAGMYYLYISVGNKGVKQKFEVE